ncbi:endonuclease/exonuclease/phosphatase family protein [Amycolatopsis acidicola]|uniref:endonuclease/exonuclease/phosphatase family protein n=1 Tax=Amycolatopsis acidicola TaxID=2596893 RepID=UPI0014090CAB|nr:endonuclease/exonuclease/phosphatase family protein [Amycolatopsis acidicola]
MERSLSLRVLTLNVWNTEGPAFRQPLLPGAIAALRPDLVSLQEVGREQLARVLAGTDLFAVHQTDLLAPHDLTRQAGTALASRWKPSAVEAVELPEGDSVECAIAATIKLPVGGDLLFLAVKPTWRLDSEAARLAQARAIADFDAKLRGPVPSVIAGDFDATPDADSMRFLAGRAVSECTSVHYHDSWTIGGDGGEGHTWTTENPLAAPVVDALVGQSPHARRIDYVLVGSRHNHPEVAAHVRRCEVVLTDPPLSDHYGVLAEIEIRPLS